MDITTRYLGLELDNPVVVGASPLTHTSDGVVRCAEAGAGAVVLKSLFEEQIRRDQAALSDSLAEQAGMHEEVYEYLRAGLEIRYGTRSYLEMLRQTKKNTDIPIIASINCVSDQWWVDFAQELEAAGADALELNIAILPHTLKDTGRAITERYETIVNEAVRAVNIPVSVKLGPYFTSLPQLLVKLHELGVSGFVLFNRFYRPTIDIENMRVVAGNRFSHRDELSVTLRNLALFSGAVPCSFAAASGVHTGEDLVRSILAGADVAQVVTAVLRNGPGHIHELLDFLDDWGAKHGYKNVAQVHGLMTLAENPAAELFSRSQYITALGGHAPR